MRDRVGSGETETGWTDIVETVGMQIVADRHWVTENTETEKTSTSKSNSGGQETV